MSQIITRTSPFKLRPYQNDCVQQIHNHLSKYTRLELVAGTGAGKTIMASQLTQDFLDDGLRVGFLVNRNTLVQQTAKKFQHLPISIIAGKHPSQLDRPLQIASIPTLKRRGFDWFQKKCKCDVLIFDECHLTSWDSFSLKLFPRLNEQKVPDTQACIGLTGTPWRLSPYEEMGDIFQREVLAPLPVELVEEGFLSPWAYFSIGKIDKQGLILNKYGEYESRSLKVRCDVPEVIEHIVDSWFELAYGHTTIVFCIDIEHANNFASAFNRRGIPAASVDGTMSTKKRQVIYDQLQNGEILVVCSCEALSEGFDVPIVSCVVLGRLSQSIAKIFQQKGRGLRPADGKTYCLILDPVGVISDNDWYIEDLTEDDFRLISSDEARENRKKKKAKTPRKTCPQCNIILHSSVKICSHCRYKFPSNYQVAPPQTLNLVIPKSSQKKYKHYQKLVRQAYQKQTSFINADNLFKSTYGHYPPASWRKGAIFGESPSEADKKNYLNYLNLLVRKHQIKDPQWIDKNCWEF